MVSKVRILYLYKYDNYQLSILIYNYKLNQKHKIDARSISEQKPFLFSYP